MSAALAGSGTVTRLGDQPPGDIVTLLGRYGLSVSVVEPGVVIPGSFWGAPEAGLRGSTLFARADTPLHSILHEAGHFVCMPASRRACLDTNAGGDFDEENGVCYLQILLSDYLPAFSRARMFADMDAWGYTFRLGGARAWFERDATDAQEWLRDRGLTDLSGAPSFRLRRDD